MKFVSLYIFVILFWNMSGKIFLKDDLKPKERKLFLRWERNEQWKRHIDRERFREELVRRMQEMTRMHNTRLSM